MEAALTNKIFAAKYSSIMSFNEYSNYLEQGLRLITNGGIQQCKELSELKAVRIAMEYNRKVSLISACSNKGIFDSYVEALAIAEQTK
jgi:hypothetical protein